MQAIIATKGKSKWNIKSAKKKGARKKTITPAQTERKSENPRKVRASNASKPPCAKSFEVPCTMLWGNKEESLRYIEISMKSAPFQNNGLLLEMKLMKNSSNPMRKASTAGKIKFGSETFKNDEITIASVTPKLGRTTANIM